MPALAIDHDGWVQWQMPPSPASPVQPSIVIQHCPSPNQDERPSGVQAELLVLHNISLPPGRFGGGAVVDFFLNRLDCSSHLFFDALKNVRVSAHFFVRRDGSLVQFVSTLARAWHAGASNFEGRTRCNDFSIGVELEGTDTLPYEDTQYRTLAVLTCALRSRHPLRAVRGHEHIAPGRKTDPGPGFDWPRYLEEAGWQMTDGPPLPAPQT